MKKIERALRWMPSWMKIMISFAGGASPLLFAIYFSIAEQGGVEYSAETYHKVLYGISIVVLTIMIACRIEVMRISREAGRDFLTGLLNRRSFHNGIETLLLSQVAKEPEQPMASIAFIDLDHFKSLNDAIGHQAGDEALRIVSQLIHSVSRASDSSARLGGDEFAIAYPRMSQAEAVKRMESLREKIENDQRLTFKDKSFTERRITISAGVTTVTGTMVNKWREEGFSVERILEEKILPKADKSLYKAKRDGRNRIVTESDGD